MKHVARNTNRSHRSETKSRRAARVRIGLVLACALGVLLAGVAVFQEVLPWKPASDGVAMAVPAVNNPDPEGGGGGGGGGSPPDPVSIPDAQPGGPRPWESSAGISTYSTVNMLNRNVLTVIPIVSWTGIGPSMSMNLYHNSATVDWNIDLTRGMGFNIGCGWTTSFSAQLYASGIGMVVIGDDGTRDFFTASGSAWFPPPGVHDKLTYDATALKYTLKHKDQSYDEFDDDGLLIAIVDALGNRITIQRVDGGNGNRIDTVTDAAGRILQFVYNGQALHKIVDPVEPEDNADSIQQREWTFVFGGQPSFDVIDPMGYRIGVQYDSEGRIERIVDRHHPDDFPGWYEYEYDITFERDRDALRKVTDPLNIVQEFRSFYDGNKRFHVNHTDNRGNVWVYDSWQGATPRLINDAPIGAITNPLGEKSTFNYDDDRNLLQRSDPLNNTWTNTYDDSGNMLTAASPLHDPPNFQHRQDWTYDDYPAGHALQGQIYNNVTSYTDAAGNETTYQYDEPGYATLLTSFIEPDDGEGNGPAATTIAYYLAPYSTDTCAAGAGECRHGRMYRVTDPNGVVAGFDYDRWGQLDMYGEGTTNGFTYIYRLDMTNDSASRTAITQASGTASRASPPGGLSFYNPNNSVTSSTCISTPRSADDGSRFAPSTFPPLPCPSTVPSFRYHATGYTASYTPMGQMATFDIPEGQGLNAFPGQDATFTYNAVGDMTDRSINRTAWGGGASDRIFTYDREREPTPDGMNLRYTGKTTRLGPDGVDTITQQDAAGRVVSLDRRLENNGPYLLTAAYEYYANGLLQRVTFDLPGSGPRTEYTYDAAGRLTVIDHQNDLGISLLKLTYGYDNLDLPFKLTERDALNLLAITDFRYDNRGRLLSECRTAMNGGLGAYDLSYEYDLGGNRTTKTDALNGRLDVYTYDLDDPAVYQTENNRLMFVESFDTGGGGQDPLSTTYYYYNDVGNVERILTRSATQNAVTVTRLHYAANQVAVTYILGEHWDWDGVAGSCPTNYGVDYAFEYYSDGPRVRWAVREIDLTTLNDSDSNYGVLSTVFSEYDGNQIYNDLTIAGGDVTVLRSYQPGVGHVTNPFDLPNRVAKYYHPDKIGTTRMMSFPGGTATDASVYTAFGELVDGTNHRYGYVGSEGYQAHDEFSLLHVGARYYDPSIGRFVQRDPIGIFGGLNVYAYVENSPLSGVDPTGLTKGGKQNVTPSDLPRNWDKMGTKDQQSVINNKINNSKSPKHKSTWRAWKKLWKRNKIDQVSTPPWWARIGQHLPSDSTIKTMQTCVAGLGAAAAAGAIIIGSGGAAIPVLVPAAF